MIKLLFTSAESLGVRLLIRFDKFSIETGEIFFNKNPLLKEVFKSNASAHMGESFDIIFDLVDISAKHEILTPYIEYISSVIELYAHICLSRNN